MSARILVAADDSDLRELMTTLLHTDERHQYAVETVERGDDVLDAIDQCLPDLLILDLMMPGQDGLQLLRHLATEHRALPVVVITAYPLARAVEHLSGAEIHLRRVSFLQKPFENDELLANVQLALAEKP